MITRSDVMEVFLTNLRAIGGLPDLTEIDESLNLEALGAESLDLVEAIYGTMEQLRAPLSSREMSDVSTVGELVTLLHQAATR